LLRHKHHTYQAVSYHQVDGSEYAALRYFFELLSDTFSKLLWLQQQQKQAHAQPEESNLLPTLTPAQLQVHLRV
jgi:hypothetical protein